MTRKEYTLRDLGFEPRGCSNPVLTIASQPMILPQNLRHTCDAQTDYDEAILRVGIALAILRTLDSGALDAENLRKAVAQECGVNAARLYFADAIEGLTKGNYIRTANGVLKVTTKGTA